MIDHCATGFRLRVLKNLPYLDLSEHGASLVKQLCYVRNKLFKEQLILVKQAPCQIILVSPYH